MKTKLNRLFSTLNQRWCRREPVLNFEDGCIEEEEQDASTQFLKTEMKQLIDFQDHLEKYCNVLPIFDISMVKYYLTLIKNYFLPLLVIERMIELKVVKKTNQFVSFKFGDVQQLDILNFLRGAASLDSYLKAYVTPETKKYFPNEWVDDPEKLNNTQLTPY